MPRAAWDCHAHVFGPNRRFAYAPNAQYRSPDQPGADYLRMLDAVGIQYGVLSQPSVYGDDNACLLEALRVSNGRLRGVVVADVLALGDAELEAMTALGVRALRINLALPGGLSITRLADLSARLQEIGWHVEIVLDRIDSVRSLLPALRSGSVPIVIEQMGSIRAADGLACAGFADLIGLLRDRAVWVKLSHAYKISTVPPAYEDTLPYAQALVAAMPSRLLWGSDWPHPRVPGPMPDDGVLLDLLLNWVNRDMGLVEAILCTSPETLYGRAGDADPGLSD